ncbi:MAG: hypothetical protein ACLUZZ_01435 [Alistipes inops]
MAEGKVHIEMTAGRGSGGVVNAISQAERSLAGGNGWPARDIVHNRLEVQRLEAWPPHGQHEELRDWPADGAHPPTGNPFHI